MCSVTTCDAHSTRLDIPVAESTCHTSYRDQKIAANGAEKYYWVHVFLCQIAFYLCLLWHWQTRAPTLNVLDQKRHTYHQAHVAKLGKQRTRPPIGVLRTLSSYNSVSFFCSVWGAVGNLLTMNLWTVLNYSLMRWLPFNLRANQS